MAIDFPAGAVATDRFTDGGKTWEFDGSGWNLVLSALQIPLNSIDSSHLVNDAVHTTKIIDNAVTRAKIVDDAIDVNKLDAGTPTHNYYLRSNTGVASGMEWASVQALSSLDDLGDVSIIESYALGDTGPAGGIIFITPSTVGNTTGKYFEAAPSASIVQRKWSHDAYSTSAVSGADGSAIGTGQQNTLDIIAQGNTSPSISAAAYADGYTYGGYSDWFLPSRNELTAMHTNKTLIGGFSEGYYWTSTEYGTPAWYSWARYFLGGLDGYEDGTSKSSTSIYVRPVRSFTPSSTALVNDFLKWNGTAWVNDRIDLATDTNGNYVSSVTAGKAITVTHTPSEGSSPTVAVVVEDDQLILASRIF